MDEVEKKILENSAWNYYLSLGVKDKVTTFVGSNLDSLFRNKLSNLLSGMRDNDIDVAYTTHPAFVFYTKDPVHVPTAWVEHPAVIGWYLMDDHLFDKLKSNNTKKCIIFCVECSGVNGDCSDGQFFVRMVELRSKESYTPIELVRLLKAEHYDNSRN